MIEMANYFDARRISPRTYEGYVMPTWLRKQLGDVPVSSRILDFGCGFGQLIGTCGALGYTRVEGADVDTKALAYCRQKGYVVHDLLHSGEDLFRSNHGQFEVIVAQHVLEHLPKAQVTGVVSQLRGLLSATGKLLVAVPNGQAFTGAYWAYEDFTHETLYTAGSIYYVLRSAGFSDIRFVDIDCTEGLGRFKATIRRAAWRMFSLHYKLMCALLASPTHRQSPNVFSYEIKVVAR